MGNNLQKYKWIVYCTICNKNNKVYIGVHKTKTPDVFDGYIGGGLEIGTEIKHPKTAYEYALKKYGYAAFTRYTFYITDNEEDAYNLERKIVNPEWVKNKNNYNTHLGGKGGGKPKCFYQYDLSGKLIKEWNSRFEILDFYNIEKDCNRICRAVKNKTSMFDSFWSEKKYDKLNINEYKSNKFAKLYAYDLDGKFIKTYNDANEAAEDLKTTTNFVHEGITKKQPVKKTFLVKNPEDLPNIIKIYELKQNSLKDGCVSLYKNRRLVRTYANIKDLSKFLMVSSKEIKTAIETGSTLNDFNIAYGFNDEFSINNNPKIKVAQYDFETGNFIKVYDSISECRKDHPKVKLVLAGIRSQTHNSTFKIVS